MGCYGEKYSYKDHEFEYVGSGVIYKCSKCAELHDVFNFRDRIKKCRGKKRAKGKYLGGDATRRIAQEAIAKAEGRIND